MKFFKKELFILLSYNLLNMFLLLIIFRGTSVIYGDGPAGFGEAIVKGIIELFSVPIFLSGLLVTVLGYKEKSLTSKVNIIVASIISILLILISSSMIHDACNNEKGYCRNWTIHFQ